MSGIGHLISDIANPISAITGGGGGGGGSSGLSGILGGVGGILGGNNAASSAATAQNVVDPFGPYRQQYAGQLNALMTNPNYIFSDPSYQFRLNQGLNAVQGSAAANGTLHSGNTLAALMGYGQGLASTEFSSEEQRLSQLAGAGIAPSNAAGQYSQQSNTAGFQGLLSGIPNILGGLGSLFGGGGQTAGETAGGSYLGGLGSDYSAFGGNVPDVSAFTGGAGGQSLFY